ncbi:mechanosensitive ion channel family protein [Halalkalibacterium ligniniphilum]|uniref:mechanosensitive ion channel family protein n=1 Tax=Halalkalibacterium ligniniphilum TaxID=1134413 RepID=UPI000348B643|nr:mechanosensitive ion channel family protein [Halalkalibacterium ligniniphilum]
MNQWFQEFSWDVFLTNTFLLIGQILLALVAFSLALSIGKRMISGSFLKMQKRKNMSSGRIKTLEKLSINSFYYVLFFVLLTVIMTIFNLNPAGLIAGAGVVGLAIGFGAQGLVSDVVTGFFLLLEKQIDVDDYITAAGVDGIVEEVGLRTTLIRAFDGTLHFIPNRNINNVSNHSRGNMQALVDISISYHDDIDKAIAVLQATCDQVAQQEEAIKEGPNVIGVQQLGQSDVVIRVLAKTENMMQWAVERKLRKALKEALDANNIEIPYPHQVYIEKTVKA